MKNLTVFIALVLSISAGAQQFEIPAQKFPYSDVIEWKGMGAILMSKDPSQKTRQVTLTLVGNQETTIWDQKFNPRAEAFYYISSENARYVYFMDNLNLEGGKAYFSQLNSAGNIKTTNVSIGTAVKKVGVSDYNDLELINIVVTDKALVHHFRYDDKKNKSIKEIATFITHHNFLCYAVELGSIKVSALKDENIGQWDYVGFTGDHIYFAARDYINKTKGWSVKEYTSKGKPGTGLFINAPEDLIALENIGFGTTGKYYLKDRTTVDKGMLTYINSKFYMIGAQRKPTGAELTLYGLEGSEWNELNSMKLNYFIEKKTLKLGVYPMNEGIGYHLDHNGYNKASVISFTPQKESAHNSFTERTIYNPSSVFTRKEKEEFSVTLPDAVLTFDTRQLNKAGGVKFELEKK
ncbi:MAG: hypothetical protein JKY09_02330 [Crocinitomicaceae bacterium]|nr:hypothetical protein [Crocinitomicaceae bacterium]